MERHDIAFGQQGFNGRRLTTCGYNFASVYARVVNKNATLEGCQTTRNLAPNPAESDNADGHRFEAPHRLKWHGQAPLSVAHM